jgi:hypothetical protein
MPPRSPALPRPRRSGSGNQTIGYLGKPLQGSNIPLTIGTSAFDTIRFGSSLRVMDGLPCLLLLLLWYPSRAAPTLSNARTHRGTGISPRTLHLASTPSATSSLWPRPHLALFVRPASGQLDAHLRRTTSSQNTKILYVSRHRDVRCKCT